MRRTFFPIAVFLIAGLVCLPQLLLSQDKDVVKETVKDKRADFPIENKPGPGGDNGGDSTKRPRVIGEVDLGFANSSVVRMVIVTPTIDVQTPYGKLTIPVNDIKQIEFGVHYAEGLERKIEEALLKLGSESFRERENATAELIRIGADAYPAVHNLAAATAVDLEKGRRIKTILQTLKANLPAKEQRLQHNDVIVLPTFTLVGRIITPAVVARAEYFGEVQLPITQLRTLRSTESPSEVVVSVDAARYASANEWLQTEFQSDGRTKVSISASGTIDLWPQQGGGYSCGPSGYNQGGGQAFIGVGANRVRVLPGQLIGKFGENGSPFVIGDSYENVPRGEGKLYLSMGPSPWQNNGAQPSGAFEVRVRAKH